MATTSTSNRRASVLQPYLRFENKNPRDENLICYLLFIVGRLQRSIPRFQQTKGRRSMKDSMVIPWPKKLTKKFENTALKYIFNFIDLKSFLELPKSKIYMTKSTKTQFKKLCLDLYTSNQNLILPFTRVEEEIRNAKIENKKIKTKHDFDETADEKEKTLESFKKLCQDFYISNQNFMLPLPKIEEEVENGKIENEKIKTKHYSDETTDEKEKTLESIDSAYSSADENATDESLNEYLIEMIDKPPSSKRRKMNVPNELINFNVLEIKESSTVNETEESKWNSSSIKSEPGCSTLPDNHAASDDLSSLIVTNFRTEKARLLSFPDDWKGCVSPGELARCGFYWVTESNSTKCAFCSKEMQFLEEVDSVEEEHAKWSPNCPLVRGLVQADQRKPSDVCGFYSTLPGNECGLLYPTMENHQSSPEELGLVNIQPAIHSEYVSFEARLNTYTTWPVSMAQTPVALAEAGFFYTGKGDRVICFQCGGGLTDWDREDDPWEEHDMWFEKCPFLRLNKGPDFRKKEPIDYTNVKPNTTNTPTETEDCKHSPGSNLLNKEAEDNEKIVNRKCGVCRENEVCTVLLPCGHVLACLECAPQLQVCPTCNKRTNAYVKIFLP